MIIVNNMFLRSQFLGSRNYVFWSFMHMFLNGYMAELQLAQLSR